MVAQVCSAASRLLKQLTATCAPAAASSRAIALPSPRDPPVTSAVRFFLAVSIQHSSCELGGLLPEIMLHLRWSVQPGHRGGRPFPALLCCGLKPDGAGSQPLRLRCRCSGHGCKRQRCRLATKRLEEIGLSSLHWKCKHGIRALP